MVTGKQPCGVQRTQRLTGRMLSLRLQITRARLCVLLLLISPPLVTMSRTSGTRSGQAASSAGGSGGPSSKFGGGPLLRTKHIDTLEVLEEYSRDVERLQKENKALQQQMSKIVRHAQQSTAARRGTRCALASGC